MESSRTGKMIGGILLVSGCCIGAGMLGLPIMSALAGFRPSLLMFVLSWLFMVTTGLLFLEVNLSFRGDVSIITMAEKTVGLIGVAVGWMVFLFLFYSLMVAYVAGSGELFADFCEELFHIQVAQWVGGLLVLLLFGVLLYLGTGAVDQFNRILMAGLIGFYVLLVLVGLPHVKVSFLKYTDWSASLLAIPAMIISFGYHNLIPSLTTYMEGDVKALRKIIIIGSGIPLLVYLVWQLVILGLVPINGGFQEALDQGDMATRVLRNAVGSSWIVDMVEYFAFFAIITSFLSVALSFVDFLADGLQIEKTPKGKVFLCLLVLLPPFVCALYFPKAFLIALNYAGGYGAVILFGILPAAMVWAGRYRLKRWKERLVPGGKITLIVVILFAVAVMVAQTLTQLGWKP